MSETGDWLREQINQALTPGQLAAHDQEFRDAETIAAALLTHYVNWCGSLEQGDIKTAAQLHAKFLQRFNETGQDAMFMVIVSLCNTLYQELLVRHGSFQAMVANSLKGDLFAGRDLEQFKLFKQLEDLE
jgi:hypothetical protein